jgi:hypothetical protein
MNLGRAYMAHNNGWGQGKGGMCPGRRAVSWNSDFMSSL